MFTIFSTKRKSLLAVTCALALALGAVGGGLAVSANAEGETAEVTPIIPLAKYEFLVPEKILWEITTFPCEWLTGKRPER